MVMGPDPGFGIYIHWPFCQAKCPYCDFNSHVTANVDTGRWARALTSEIQRQALLCDRRQVTSVFFGGGTPSLMPPEVVGACLDEIGRCFDVAPDCEVSLEANPTSTDADRFAGYRAGGVNRLSLGVQALDDASLKRLGRLHTADEAMAAFEIARKTFDRVSFDLIYARQDQGLQDWCGELDQALDLAIDHLSLYQLTIEPGTRFGDLHARGGLQGLPDEGLSAALYETTLERCSAVGLEFYEVSNGARVGAECRHNLTYWRYGAYLGIGPGAHGRMDRNGVRYATESLKMPGAWLQAVEQDGAVRSSRLLDGADMGAEYALMGLRLAKGVSLERFSALGGALDEKEVAALVKDGLLTARGDTLATTPQGRLVLNAVLARILA